MLANGEAPDDMLQNGSISSEFTLFDMVKLSSGIEIYHYLEIQPVTPHNTILIVFIYMGNPSEYKRLMLTQTFCMLFYRAPVQVY